MIDSFTTDEMYHNMKSQNDILLDAVFALLHEGTCISAPFAIPQMSVPLSMLNDLKAVFIDSPQYWNHASLCHDEYASLIKAALNVVNYAQIDKDDAYFPEHLFDDLDQYATDYVRLINPTSPLLFA